MSLVQELSRTGERVIVHQPSWPDRIFFLIAFLTAVLFFVIVSNDQRTIIDNQQKILRNHEAIMKSLDKAEADRIEALRLLHNVVEPPKE